MDPKIYLNFLVFLALLLFIVNFLSFTHQSIIMLSSRNFTQRKSPGGTSPRLQIADRLRMLRIVLRLGRTDPPQPWLDFTQVGRYIGPHSLLRSLSPSRQRRY
jgi:hypothetical protein